MIEGAYTSNNNQLDMLFATPLIKGDIIVAEGLKKVRPRGKIKPINK